jgi:hypothetical protein
VEQLVFIQLPLCDRTFDNWTRGPLIGKKLGRPVRGVLRLVVHVLPAADGSEHQQRQG